MPAHNNITYKQLRAFVEVARTLSYAQAAERMHITQPALSLSIKNLEEMLGGKLFKRSTRTLTLTPEGELFLPDAKRLLQSWQDCLQDVHNLFAMNRGRMTIASMPSFAGSLLPVLLRQFNQQFPSISLSVLDIVMEDVIKSVLNGDSEIGFVFKPDTLSGLEFIPLFMNDFVVVVAKGHALMDCSELSWQQISGQKYVSINRGASIRGWIDLVLQRHDVTLDVVAEAGQLDTIGQLVAAGLGISIVPALCNNQMRAKGLTTIPLLDSGLKKEVGMIRQIRSNLSQPAAELWHMATVTDFDFN